ncbi:SHOCT domain-containing protein [Aquipuribacter sp. MA13-6]|uniref:SHOCT domain-containing protein n=1 Tax=unclassified Aquipuribacter TaxID=2635084 RepID=UPI003EEED4B9
MGWVWVFWLLLVAGTLLLVFVLVKTLSRSSAGREQGGSAPPPTGAGPQRAREVLDERYARGEIDTQEYQERRRALEGGDP